VIIDIRDHVSNQPASGGFDFYQRHYLRERATEIGLTAIGRPYCKQMGHAENQRGDEYSWCIVSGQEIGDSGLCEWHAHELGLDEED
jgi:hypothetical protein